MHRIDSAGVNEWISAAAGSRVTAKDFRTWHGSVHALALLLAGTSDAGPAAQRDMIAGVSRRLRNTPAVCRQSYIHPRVLSLCGAAGDTTWRDDLNRRRWVGAPPAVSGLGRDERRLMGLLRERRAAPAR